MSGYFNASSAESNSRLYWNLDSYFKTEQQRESRIGEIKIKKNLYKIQKFLMGEIKDAPDELQRNL